MAKTWYPVIDYTACGACGSCINMCSQGVYDTEKAPTPVVKKPEGCVDHCHGCGSLCPQGAITYVGEDTGLTPPNGADLPDSVLCFCGSEDTDKTLEIDFLYLDHTACGRCKAADSTLNEAIEDISGKLEALGYSIIVNRIEITSRSMAEQYEFISSPTIRVNGKDICLDVRESHRRDCGDICGDDLDYRVFVYQGAQYAVPPKEMIIEGIFNAIKDGAQPEAKVPYFLPENLSKYFAGKRKSCCGGGCGCKGGCNE